MDSKKPIRLSFRWRLFIPLAIFMWTVIGILIYSQYRTEQQFREDIVSGELSNVSQRVLYNIHDPQLDVHNFLQSLQHYYKKSIYEDIAVSIYRNDTLIDHIGTIIPFRLPEGDKKLADNATRMVRIPGSKWQNRETYLTEAVSDDGHLVVKAAVPHSLSIASRMSTSSELWILMVLVTIAATLVLFFSTRFFSKSVRLLRELARSAARDEKVDLEGKFPNDELGEISREIYNIHNERMRALERSEREHRIAIHAIEEKSFLKRQMSNNINHELKTPIGVIRGYLETIAENPDMDEATRNHFLARARQNVERLCALLADVSTITRLEQGAESIPVQPLLMHEILYSIDNDVHDADLAAGMEFHYNVPLDCRVIGNQGLIQGMILNLIRNSAIHSHGTKIEFKVISESQKFYVFSFADNGVGVEAIHLSHLFDRFYRVDTGRSRKAGGTGLGLPIVKSTIQSMGGSISVHNRSTGGLEFVFTLRKAPD